MSNNKINNKITEEVFKELKSFGDDTFNVIDITISKTLATAIKDIEKLRKQECTNRVLCKYKMLEKRYEGVCQKCAFAFYITDVLQNLQSNQQEKKT